MSAVSAVPAVVRLPHTAAARRALLTFLFLGGFLALAVVLGGSAQAASAPGHDVRAAGGASSELVASQKPSASGGGSSDEASRTGKQKKATQKTGKHKHTGKHKPGKNTAGHALTPAERAAKHRHELRNAAERTTSSVMDPVEEGADRTGKATRPVGEAVDSASGPSGLAGLPGRLGLGLGEAVGEGPSGSGGHDGDAGSDDASHATADDSRDRTDGPRTHGGRAVPSLSPASGAAGEAPDAAASDGNEDPSERLPFHRVPAVPGPSASQCTGDGHGQRGGPHQHHAVLPRTEPFGPLQHGAVRAADGTPTRDSAGDVLEFPG